jgi:hypothetical protein
MLQRSTKRRLIILLCVLAITALGAYGFNRYELRTKAFMWHAMHGDSIVVAAGPLAISLIGGMRKAQRNDFTEFYSIMASLQKDSR